MAGVRTVVGLANDVIASYGANSTPATPTEKKESTKQVEDVYLQMQQTAISKQVNEFNEAVQLLNRRLRVFSSGGMFEQYYAKSGSGEGFSNFVSNSLRSLVAAYNQVNGVIKSSGYMTKEGTRLLDHVRALLQGKEGQDFRNMGLTMDANTGNIKLDEKKLASYLSENADKAKKLLVDKEYLAPMLQHIVDNIQGKNTDYYFCRPFSAYV